MKADENISRMEDLEFDFSCKRASCDVYAYFSHKKDGIEIQHGRPEALFFISFSRLVEIIPTEDLVLIIQREYDEWESKLHKYYDGEEY